MAQTLTIRRPDDWHLHLRDGDMLRTVLPWSARAFARAIVMPNLVPPVTTVEAARRYRARIVAALPQSANFTPLMTCYLTDETSPDEVARGFEEGLWIGCKLYPAGATTNSASGVTDVAKLHSVLERMESLSMPLLVHGEVTDPEVDIFDREAVFLDRVLIPLRRDHTTLTVVLEHVTTAEGVSFVEDTPRTAGTITPHHLQINRNALFRGGLRPHAYCLPVAKREHHRRRLVAAATRGDPDFFAGTDSAPHPVADKESACGCAGIWNAPFALESYAAIFEAEGALDNFEAFTSEHGAHFYGLPLNKGTVTLERDEHVVPERLDGLVPFHAGERLAWRLRPEPAEA